MRIGGKRLEIGCCGGLEALASVRATGFDYCEISARQVAALGDEQFQSALSLQRREGGFPVPVANNLLPAEIKIVGPGVDPSSQSDYLTHVLTRLQRLGVEVIVFGSGGARRRPDGFPAEVAHRQLIAFCRLLAAEVAALGMVAAIEPLRRAETNLVNTVVEGLALVEEVAHPAFGLMADLFHQVCEGEPPSSLLEARSHLWHLHLADPAARTFPVGGHAATFQAWFAAVRAAGYGGRLSVEAYTRDLALDGPRALAFLRTCLVGEEPEPQH